MFIKLPQPGTIFVQPRLRTAALVDKNIELHRAESTILASVVGKEWFWVQHVRISQIAPGFSSQGVRHVAISDLPHLRPRSKELQRSKS